MKGIAFWKVNDELSVVQTALLAVNCDPAKYSAVEEWDVEARPEGYEAIVTLFKNKVLSGELPAKIRHLSYSTHFTYDESSEFIPSDSPDWNATLVKRGDVVNLLSQRGYREGFFFEPHEHQPDYLDPTHPHYSITQAAGIAAWNALFANPQLLEGRTVKQAAIIYLRKNAAQLGLQKEDGSPNEQAIEDIAKVINWDKKGGAPKTPDLRLAKHNKELPPPKPPRQGKELPDPLAGDGIPY